MRKLSTLLLLAAACIPPTPWPTTWDVQSETEVPAGTDVAIALVQQLAPCDLSEHPWGGDIVFLPEPLGDAAGFCQNCGTERVVLLVYYDGTVPLPRSALVHELGHHAWALCDVPSAKHPAVFIQWVTDVNAELANQLAEL